MIFNKVYIMIDDNQYFKKVVDAYDYQTNALNDYIDNHEEGLETYNPLPDISFQIEKFKDINFQGDYSDFYNFIKEDGTVNIISKNKEKLKAFCGLRNRLIN
jgi:hypothetical protein